jgi:hypothetical protein
LSCETDSGKNDAVALQPANEDEEVSVTDATITQPAISKDIFTAGFLLALRHEHFLSFETVAFVQRNIDEIFARRLTEFEVNYIVLH